jgi:hypothetical protein
MNSIAAAAPSFSVSAAQAFVQNEDDIQRVISIGEADGALIVPSDPFTHDHATLIAVPDKLLALADEVIE